MAIGVDVGGTFTDLVMRLDGRVRVAKVPTTPAHPEQGVLHAVDAVVGPEDLPRCRHLIHGTTVGLNALIEREGSDSPVGLITTAGFRDVLEIRRGDRDDPYALTWHPPAPMVPRRHRLEVRERVMANGHVHQPLEADDVRSAAAVFTSAGISTLAVVLLHSYANPSHELQIEEILRESGFTGDISLSHRVSGEYREYERTTTTIVDAFVRRRMGPYLQTLDRELRLRGFTGELLITRSGGGALTVDQALERPVETILSGPVAGATATAGLARRHRISSALIADVGGTSFDTALVIDGELPLLYEGTVAGLPLQCPWVDVRSVGAGGGSLAIVDAGGLHVGPRSAGAIPGPACYQRGGSIATVTDSALVLGLLTEGELQPGVILSAQRARDAVDDVAAAAGLPSLDAAADGIMRIAASHMAEAIRGITVDRGVDPTASTLVAFGGAGPLFATLIADELDIPDIVVPPTAGNFSAVGLMESDLVRSASRTLIAPLDDTGFARVGEAASQLLAGIPGDGGDTAVFVDLRFSGQEHTLTVSLAGDVESTYQCFLSAYRAAYGHQLDSAAEIVTVRVQHWVALRSADDHAPAQHPSTPDGTAPGTTRHVWSCRAQRRLDFAVVDRLDLAPTGGQGPLLVTEPTSTTYVDQGYHAHPEGEILRVARTSGADA